MPTLAHGERVRHRNVVLSFTAFGHHVLLVHQLIFKSSLKAPFYIVGVFVFKPLSLSPSGVDICDRETTEDEFFPGAKLATSTEVLNEKVPVDTLFLIIARNSQEQAIQSLSFLISRLSHDVVQTPLQVLIIANVVEEFFHFDMVKMLFFSELAGDEDPSEGLDHFILHVDDTFPLDELHGFSLDDTEGAGNPLHLLAPLQELFRGLLCLHHLIQRAFVPCCRVERRRLLHLLQLLWDLCHWLLDIPLVHVLLKVVFKLLSLGGEDFLALGRSDGHLRGKLKIVSHASHLLLGDTSHAFLDHEGVHLHVGLKTATIGRVGQRVVFEMFPDFEVLLLLSEYFVETLNLAPFQIKLFLDFVNARLVFLQEHVKLSHVHLADGTVVVGDS